MEKTGSLELTQEDLSFFSAGVVSPRIQQNWGLDFQSLKEAIETGQYVVVDAPHFNS